MHAALADDHGEEDFTPQPLTRLYLRSLYQSLRNSARRSLQMLRKHRRRLPEAEAERARSLLEREAELMERLAAVRTGTLDGARTRCHGDYHLGQVLWTGRDFVIIDFEGEPARPLSERRLKWTPLRDVAGMIRSFQYAAWTGLHRQITRGSIADSAEARAAWAPAAAAWEQWAAAAFLGTYLDTLRERRADLLPAANDDVRRLLDAWLLEKALYEVRYELDNRPDWIGIPLHGVLEILDTTA